VVAPLAVPIAFGLDVAVGEPPRRLHPVAWFGTLVAPLDRDWQHPWLVGATLAVLAPLGSAVLVGFLVWAVATFSTPAGVGFAGLVLFVTASYRRLLDRARSVIDASATAPDAARGELPALVGRDPEGLSEGQVRSAAVESVAENLADGLVAPLGAFAVAVALGLAVGLPVALALGTAAATCVKAVNTLDSMVGYPEKPHGRAAARLDDAVMWVPARVTAGLLALVAARPGAVRPVRSWLDAVASPNAGWPIGTLAAVTDCRLEKPGAYVVNDAAALPAVSTARGAVRTVAVAGLAAYALAALVAALGVIAWS